MSVDFTQGNMAAVATAFGIKSFHVKTPDELDQAFHYALEYKGPVFIDVVTEPEVITRIKPTVSLWNNLAR